ncbi:unnamed protein product [Didymodactylos carnosus]|uniref:Uncharacterized protein n=1 Tax=Didymodactylos carnosus TaxID=1234261 RepID=A0A8S2DHI8_9BILA|nr:unnamed protein product [Didymodactylos carnosus]CAF3678275.1 unnamed protein product [Didymodactylos carnosus]
MNKLVILLLLTINIALLMAESPCANPTSIYCSKQERCCEAASPICCPDVCCYEKHPVCCGKICCDQNQLCGKDNKSCINK